MRLLGRLPSGFPLITPAEHSRRKAEPQGGVLIKMSLFAGLLSSSLLGDDSCGCTVCSFLPLLA